AEALLEHETKLERHRAEVVEPAARAVGVGEDVIVVEVVGRPEHGEDLPALGLPPRLDLLAEVLVRDADTVPELALQLVLRGLGQGVALLPEAPDELASLRV